MDQQEQGLRSFFDTLSESMQATSEMSGHVGNISTMAKKTFSYAQEVSMISDFLSDISRNMEKCIPDVLENNMQGRNRRKYERYKVLSVVKINSGKESVTCNMMDISLSGMAIKGVLPDVIRENKTVQVEFDNGYKMFADLLWQSGNKTGMVFHHQLSSFTEVGIELEHNADPE